MRAKKEHPWTDEELRALHARYMAGEFPAEMAKMRHRKSAYLLERWREMGLPIRAKRKFVMPMRTSAAIAEAMYADYQAGMSFAEVERRHGRGPKSARNLFITRGWPIREPNPNANRHHKPDGTWVAYPPKTPEEIEAIIQASTRVIIPKELSQEWRKWDLARRADYIRRVRARIASPKDVLALPFSANVTYFDYGTPAAWDIVERVNAGHTSRTAPMSIKIVSQGVIWQDSLWFWVREDGYYMEGVQWKPGRPRRSLTRAIWETVHGPLPHKAVVRIIDGNPNNLDPSNLTLSDKNEICRENQAAALTRKSRARTAAILNLHHTPHNEHAQMLQDLGRRAR